MPFQHLPVRLGWVGLGRPVSQRGAGFKETALERAETKG